MTKPIPAADRLAAIIAPFIGRPMTRAELETLATTAYQEGFKDGRQSPPAIVKIGTQHHRPELET